MTTEIKVHEVGLRDGLQMEHQTVPLGQKAGWLRTLLTSGLDMIQVGSFVNPARVPQMGDTDQLFRDFTAEARGKVVLSALVLNEKGLERGLECGVEMFCMGVSASETHSRKNTGMSVAEATRRIIAMARTALDQEKKVQVSVQSAFGCGFEGPVPQERVLGIARQYIDAGLTTISLADTAGHATPDQVEHMFEELQLLGNGIVCACHFHNTYGLGLANSYAALRAGVRYFESAVAGLGGCPFTKVAGGNVSTEDLVHMLQRMGLRPDIDLDSLIVCARNMAQYFQREMPGMVYRVGPVTRPVPSTRDA
jgi:hydroxymethylglutaryl-CoA lyase